MTDLPEKNTFWRKAKKMLLSNWLLKLAAVLFAILIWAYVLANENPVRVKYVSGVVATFEGESDLNARNLIVRGDYTDIMNDITVRINTELTKYTDVTAERIVAKVSLDNVTTSGTYKLRVEATSTDGRIVNVSPEKIEVEVDRLIARKVPVNINVTGAPEQGFWYGEPTLLRDEIEIKGPSTDISRIDAATGIIDITGITSSFTRSVELMLTDENADTISSDILCGELPASTVSMEVEPCKSVGFDIEGAITNLESIPSDYEISDAYTQPQNVTITGSRELLDTISVLSISGFEIPDTQNAGIVKEREILIPDGVRIVGGITKVTVHVTITEKVTEKKFTALPVSAINLKTGLKAKLEQSSVTLNLSGRLSLINKLSRGNIYIYVDCEGLDAGTYTLPVELRYKTDSGIYKELESTLEIQEIQVIIK